MARYTVTRDGQTLATRDTESDAWAFLLWQQGSSVLHAVTHEGYDIIYPDGGRLSEAHKEENSNA